jgi:starvation-inducible DNA-binding protein
MPIIPKTHFEFIPSYTPVTDAADPTVQSLPEMLNELLSDLFVCFHQYKQHHWLTSGPTFRDVHLMFDEATDVILEAIDDVGERIVAFGLVPNTSLLAIQVSHGIPKLPQETRNTQLFLENALDMTKYLLGDMQEISKVADDQEEYGVEQLIGDIMMHLEKLQYKYQQFLGTFG